MPVLDTTRNYANGEILLELDLDYIRTDIETLVNTTLLDDDNFQSNSVTSVKLIDSTLVTNNLADGAITTAKIDDAAIVTAKIVDSAVTADKIASSNITTTKVLDDAVTTAKIADGAVTAAKLSAINKTLATNSTSTYSQATSAVTAITNASVSITTSGRPVWIQLQADGSSNLARIGSSTTAAGGTTSYNDVQMQIVFKRFATTLSKAEFWTSEAVAAGLNIPASAFIYVDQPPAGTYTYTASMSWTQNDRGTGYAYYAKLVVYEL